MMITRQHRRVRAQSADRDDEIGQRQNFPCAIQPPGQLFGLCPGPMIHRHMDQQIEELRQIRSRSWPNHSAQNFAANQIAPNNFGSVETSG